jgi:hypothetical protein
MTTPTIMSSFLLFFGEAVVGAGVGPTDGGAAFGSVGGVGAATGSGVAVGIGAGVC